MGSGKKSFLNPFGIGGGQGSALDPSGFFSKKKATTPETSPAVPIDAAPVTSNSAEVAQSKQDWLRQEMMKKSIRKTIYAGDTGGYKGGSGGGGPAAAMGPLGAGGGGARGVLGK